MFVGRGAGGRSVAVDRELPEWRINFFVDRVTNFPSIN
jgi:hypothetical protein